MTISDTGRWGNSESEWEGVKVIESPDLFMGRMRSGWDLWCAVNRMFFLRNQTHRFDIVHALETRPATILPTRYISRKMNIPWVTDWIDWWGRGGLITEQRPGWYQLLFGGIETYFEEHYRDKADGLTVISRALAERAERLGVEPGSVTWIPGGASPEIFPEIDKKTARERIGLPVKGDLLLFAGIDVLFDLNMVLESLQLIRRERPQARLIVTGASPETVSDLVITAGLDPGAVIVTGRLPRAAYHEHLLACDLCLLPFSDTPSNNGRWPNKVGDYMAAGRPVISNPVGEMERLLKDEEAGLLVPPTAAGFAEGCLALLDDDVAARKKGEKARILAEERLAWPKVIERLERFYEETLVRFKAGL
jgi:glycosyltransferase involved in cell wall biosynthesis